MYVYFFFFSPAYLDSDLFHWPIMFNVVAIFLPSSCTLIKCIFTTSLIFFLFFNLRRWDNVPRTSRVFCNNFSVLSIFKRNPGKATDKYITC